MRKITCAKLFRITAPARQAVQALQKPLASGGPREPGRSLAAGAFRGRGNRENRPLHLTRGSSSTPGLVVSPTDTANPGAPRWQIRTDASPRLPPLAPANGQWGGERGGAHVSDTEGSPSGRPRCYRRGQGARIRVRQVLGQQGGRYQEILVSATPLPSAQVRCPLVGVSTASCALTHPRPLGVRSAPCSLKIMETDEYKRLRRYPPRVC
jgi:hypothetical protein